LSNWWRRRRWWWRRRDLSKKEKEEAKEVEGSESEPVAPSLIW